MGRTETGPWIDFKSNTDLQSCMLCDKKTKSHGILLTLETEGEGRGWHPAEDADDADALMAVCHTCYTDVAGDAETAAAEYNAKLEESVGGFEANFLDTAAKAKQDVEREETINNSDADTAYETIESGDIVAINGHGRYMIMDQLTEDVDEGFFVNNENEVEGHYWLHRTGDDIVLKRGAPRTPGQREIVSDFEYVSNAMIELGNIMDEDEEAVEDALRDYL